jgi:hypothetical protein
MSARSEHTTVVSPLYQGAGFRRAARLALAAVVALLTVSAIVRGGLGGAGAAGLAGGLVCIAALWEARVRRVGIRIGPQGVLAVYAVGHLQFPLESVAGFGLRSRGSSGRTGVVIELLNGERRVVPSARLCPGGGTPMDVVAQLAGQLQWARQQAAAALTDGPAPAL